MLFQGIKQHIEPAYYNFSLIFSELIIRHQTTERSSESIGQDKHNTHTNTHTAHPHKHTHTYTHPTHTHIHTHTHTSPLPHTHKHTHTHTHNTHIHTRYNCTTLLAPSCGRILKLLCHL